MGSTSATGLASVGAVGAPGATGAGPLTSGGASGSGVEEGPASRPSACFCGAAWLQAGPPKPPLSTDTESAIASSGLLTIPVSPRRHVWFEATKPYRIVVWRLADAPVQSPEVPVSVWQSCTAHATVMPPVDASEPTQTWYNQDDCARGEWFHGARACPLDQANVWSRSREARSRTHELIAAGANCSLSCNGHPQSGDALWRLPGP